MPQLSQIRAVTSASNIFRRKLCPGSERMEAGIYEPDSEYSREGKMLHELFLTGIRATFLTPDQHETLNLADKLATEFFDKLCAENGIPPGTAYVEEREQDMMLRTAAGHPLFPGHADVIRTWPEYEVRGIVDAKFGYLEVDHAADNTQTASYAAMKQQTDPVKVTGVAIVQPRNFGPRITMAVYVAAALPSAVAELEGIVAAAKAPDAPLIAGEQQCHYCKAKVKCPAFLARSNAVTVVGTRAVAELKPDELIAVWSACKFASKIASDVSDEMRRRVKAGELPGYKLQSSGDVVNLEDSTGLFIALGAHFAGNPAFTATAYDDCREMGWGRLTGLIQNLTGLSEKKAKEFIDDMNKPFVTRVPKAERVVLDKPKKLK